MGKEPFWKKRQKKHLSSGDYALFIVSFTAIFGILCNNPVNDLYHLLVTVASVAFWIWILYSAGCRMVKGGWMTALILWGLAFAYCFLYYLIAVPFHDPENLNSIVSTILSILYIPASALLNPLFPIVYYTGYQAATVADFSVFQLLLCLASIAVCGASFFFGVVRSRNQKKRNRTEGQALDTGDLK